MQHSASSTIVLIPEPLTQQAFADYGDVIDLSSGVRRRELTLAFERMPEANAPAAWISTPPAVNVLPLTLGQMECHPFSAQTFIPAGGDRYLIVVCDRTPHGDPDVSTMRAFVASANQGITYARGVWHHGLTALDEPARFVVIMSRTGRNDDDVFTDLHVAVQVHEPIPADFGKQNANS